MAEYDLLQRGRACEGAEMNPVPATNRTTTCFNGAAPVRARKFAENVGAGELVGLGFNGAAPVRARKWTEWKMPALRIHRFNGAAPVRARKWTVSEKMVERARKLQRGRACEGAEMYYGPTNCKGSRIASTGPRL